MPDTFNGSYDETTSAELDFRVLFDDPMLSGLIDQAMVDNQELKILAQDIDIASNETYAWTGSYLPFLNLRAGAGVDKPGRYTRDGAVEDQLQIAPGKGFPEPLPNFLLAADISWEIDIWRKLRNSRDAASLRYLATEEGRNYITTRLVAEIAENYYELLALDKRLETLDITIGLQERSLEVAKANKEAAQGTELAVQRFEAEVRKNQSEKLIIQQRLIETENRINFLAGRYPQTVERKLVDFFELNMHTINIGVPSQMLNNRADIRQAERELQAAGLEIQVALARFYPSLVLNAGVGYSAFNPRYLFITPESLVYNAIGELVAPVINRRAIKADYLNAFTEVVNRINKVENYGKSVEIKMQQLKALESSVDVATKLFQNARAEYVEVLLAQRDLQDAKVVLIETKQQQLAAIVNTYQAIGGSGVRPTYDSRRVTITDEQYVPPMIEGDIPPMLEEE